MTAKEQVRQMLDKLPDDASFEDIQYQIYVREQIRSGLEEASAGKLIPQEEIEEFMEQWIIK